MPITITTLQCKHCRKEFIAKKSNQIYCSSECCKIATNKKILEKYHENKARKTSVRHCSRCGQKLSKYNVDNECHSCQIAMKNTEKINILKQLGFAYEEEK